MSWRSINPDSVLVGRAVTAIFVPGRPFAIAVMTTFAADGLEAEESIGRIAQAAWSYFDRVAKSSSLGRLVR